MADNQAVGFTVDDITVLSHRIDKDNLRFHRSKREEDLTYSNSANELRRCLSPFRLIIAVRAERSTSDYKGHPISKHNNSHVQCAYNVYSVVRA
jgi:adenylate cyclase class IV